MSSAAWRFAFRILVSAVLAALPAYALFALLRFISALIDFDLVKATIETLINTHLAYLTSVSRYIEEHPTWAPTLAIWVAMTLTVFRSWSKRIEFFVASGQDFSAMQPLPGARGHDGIVPWVEVPPLAKPCDTTSALSPYKTWDDQHVALEELVTWAKQNPDTCSWKFWPRKPSIQPLKLALVTGANGIGKSSLGAELGNRLLTDHLTNQKNTGGAGTIHRRQLSTAVKPCLRAVLPWLRWDVGVLTSGDLNQLTALRVWEPRRPTLLIIDEPNTKTSEVLKVLAERRHAFWYPVRVLVIDQMFPAALDDYLPSSANESTSAIPLLYSEALRLGEVHFDIRAVRAMWSALCDEQRNLTTAQPRDFNAISSKLWSTDQVSLLLTQTGPNPLHIALALNELVNTHQTVLDMCKANNNDPASAALLEEVGLLAMNHGDPTPLCHRQISARADDLVKTYDGILLQQAPELRYEVMRAIAAATVAGGLTLPEHLSKRLKASTLEQMFPGGRYLHSSQDAWIPPVRPTVVARVFLETWINASAAPEAVASDIATTAWQHNAAGAMRALLRGHHLPGQLRNVLETAGSTQAQRVPWAQGCCIALLNDDAPAERFVAALDRLDTEELRSFEQWLENRLSALHPQRPHPVCVLIVLSHSVARRCLETSGAPSSAELEVAFQALIHWAVLADDTSRHRLSRQRELARATVTLLQSVITWGEAEAQGTRQFIEPLLNEYFIKGRSVSLAICRFFTRQGKSVNHQSHHWAGDVAAAHGRILPYYFACYAACALGGRPALRLSKALARRIETIVATLPELAANALSQELRAGAWGCVAMAASQLGGKRALALSKRLALHVERIVTAHADFATDVQLQGMRAATWCAVTYAASELKDKQGLALSKSLARHVEAIITAHPDFVSNTRLQARRAYAWRLVMLVASDLGGKRAFMLSTVLAHHIENIVTAQSDFATDAVLQEHRARAWESVMYAASKLGGLRALALSKKLARRVETIITANVDFTADYRLQEQRAAIWRCVTYAASELEGMRALTLSKAWARRVETITTQTDFAFAAGMQRLRADTWRHVTFAASQLGGKRALTLAIAQAHYVESITTAQADFANDPQLQEPRAGAWASVTFAASQVAEEHALLLSKALAQRVELIATANLEFTTDGDLQLQRARAWRYVTSAASRLSGRQALKLTKSLARRVEGIVTAHADFAASPRLQEQRARAWQYVTFTASEIRGMRALTLSTILARHIETIVTAQARFAADIPLQEVLAGAWSSVTYAASQLRGKRALELSIVQAQCVESITTAQAIFAADASLQICRATAWRYVVYIASEPGIEQGYETAIKTAFLVRRIVFARRWRNSGSLALQWRYTQEYLSAIGIILEGPDIGGPEP
ncbi:hypothetical protein [Pseudomonas sp. NPDC086251]|uniref:hypothetical protein n=1 Tax=Pseudomonas sp. NPDC086251 TaxID=3364431 RepID=UPI003837AC4D